MRARVRVRLLPTGYAAGARLQRVRRRRRAARAGPPRLASGAAPAARGRDQRQRAHRDRARLGWRTDALRGRPGRCSHRTARPAGRERRVCTRSAAPEASAAATGAAATRRCRRRAAGGGGGDARASWLAPVGRAAVRARLVRLRAGLGPLRRRRGAGSVAIPPCTAAAAPLRRHAGRAPPPASAAPSRRVTPAHLCLAVLVCSPSARRRAARRRPHCGVRRAQRPCLLRSGAPAGGPRAPFAPPCPPPPWPWPTLHLHRLFRPPPATTSH